MARGNRGGGNNRPQQQQQQQAPAPVRRDRSMKTTITGDKASAACGHEFRKIVGTWMVPLVLAALLILGLKACGRWASAKYDEVSRGISTQQVIVPTTAQMGEGYVILPPVGSTLAIAVPPGGKWTKVYSVPLEAQRAWFITSNQIEARCHFQDGTTKRCDASPTKWTELKSRPSGFSFRNTNAETVTITMHSR